MRGKGQGQNAKPAPILNRARSTNLFTEINGMPRLNLTPEEIEASRPTLEMMMDAWRRNTAPRSIVAWVMGDPAPGQSALDRRLAERVDA